MHWLFKTNSRLGYLKFLIGVITFLPLFYSCQKELDEDAYKTCLVSNLTIIYDGGNTPDDLYDFEYDPSTLKVNSISIDIPSSAFFRIINVSYGQNTILLGNTGNMRLDGLQRIVYLKLNSDFPGAFAGEYFYSYGSDGFLSERLYDDGVTELERTVFSNNGGALDSLAISYESDSTQLKGKLIYSETPALNTNTLLQYTDVFPELLPFFSMVKMGRLGNKPLQKIDFSIEIPGSMPINFNLAFANYLADAAGSLQSFENTLNLPGFPAFNRSFQVSYSCP